MLLDYPLFLCVDVFCGWILLKDLVHFDVALSNEKLRKIFLEHLVTFTAFHVQCPQIKIFNWCKLRNIHIKNLTLKSNQFEGGELLHFRDVARLDFLSHLNLIKISDIDATQIKHDALLTLLDACRNLIELEIIRIPNFDQKVVENMSHLCFPQLTTIKVVACNINTSNLLIEMVSEYCINLVDLSLNSDHEHKSGDVPLLDSIETKLITSNTKLQYVSIKACTMTNRMITLITSHCKEIKSIILFNYIFDYNDNINEETHVITQLINLPTVIYIHLVEVIRKFRYVSFTYKTNENKTRKHSKSLRMDVQETRRDEQFRYINMNLLFSQIFNFTEISLESMYVNEECMSIITKNNLKLTSFELMTNLSFFLMV